MSRDRVLVLIACLLAAGAVVCLRLFHMQLLSGSTWEKERRALSTRQQAIPFRRGSILDRNGVALAVDVESFALDFEYGAFRLRHPLGMAAHARTLLEGRLVTLAEVAADPRASALALLRATPGEVDGLPLASSRNDVRTAIARLSSLEGAALRQHQEDARRGSSKTKPYAELLPDAPARIADSLARAAAHLQRLDTMLAKPAGSCIDAIESVRMNAIAESERQLAEESERGDVDDDGRSARRVQILRQRESYSIRFADDAPYAAAELVSSRPDSFAGLVATETSARRYPYSNAATLVGFVTRPSKKDLDDARSKRSRAETLERLLNRNAGEQDELVRLLKDLREENYLPNEMRGAWGPGVEFQWETALRGARGVRVISDDGEHASGDVPAEDGRDVTMTIDAPAQAAGEEVLRAGIAGLRAPQLRGGIVVMDVDNGDVLVLATSPDVSREEWSDSARRSELIRRDAEKGTLDRPLHHRGFNPYDVSAPGSTFKVITALAALKRGAIDRHTTFRCPADAPSVKCESHGTVNLETALEASCNVYFAKVGELIGAEAVRAEAVRFGIGQKTGCFPLGRVEQLGTLPRSPSARDAPSVRRFAIGEHGIEVTPLQLVRVYAALANGGRLVQPRLVRAVGSIPLTPAECPDLGLPAEHRAWLREGLRQVVVGSRGTANKSGLDALKRCGVVGKTGTPEVDPKRGINNGWFAGFAPAERPRVAFAVYVERVPYHGGDVSAPIADALFARQELASLLVER